MAPVNLILQRRFSGSGSLTVFSDLEKPFFFCITDIKRLPNPVYLWRSVPHDSVVDHLLAFLNFWTVPLCFKHHLSLLGSFFCGYFDQIWQIWSLPTFNSEYQHRCGHAGRPTVQILLQPTTGRLYTEEIVLGVFFFVVFFVLNRCF